MIKDAIYYIPIACKKNKKQKVKAVLDTGINDYVVNKGIALIGERFN